MYATDPTCRELGITVEEVSEGRATARLRLADTMVNGHGTAHGGYLFLLADVAFAYACNSRGVPTVAQSAQVTFLRPARPGDQLAAEAVERSRFGRSAVYDVTVRRADGTVIAEFRGQSQALPVPPSPAPTR
ncbi:hydroxyphenylacetyl-CoA thioesterase PaaI [Streptacidiphilus griseoplanus]|uniref:hydroxyphenylacetyl-CoA thioesterase PaaI n=1 Tax=Peterkaempfera griseoplana TaxID=66896 RepID=UPI0006E42254|nr:hydroxyphenylacetyl-CoA thioesterase PaaI [Peterkaempfera griseoplana]